MELLVVCLKLDNSYGVFVFLMGMKFGEEESQVEIKKT